MIIPVNITDNKIPVDIPKNIDDRISDKMD